jgi:hypothetical protein
MIMESSALQLHTLLSLRLRCDRELEWCGMFDRDPRQIRNRHQPSRESHGYDVYGWRQLQMQLSFESCSFGNWHQRPDATTSKLEISPVVPLCKPSCKPHRRNDRSCRNNDLLRQIFPTCLQLPERSRAKVVLLFLCYDGPKCTTARCRSRIATQGSQATGLHRQGWRAGWRKVVKKYT